MFFFGVSDFGGVRLFGPRHFVPDFSGLTFQSCPVRRMSGPYTPLRPLTEPRRAPLGGPEVI